MKSSVIKLGVMATLTIATVNLLHAQDVNIIDLQVSNSDYLEYPEEEEEKYIFNPQATKARVNGGAWIAAELETRGKTCIRAPRRCLELKFQTEEKQVLIKAEGDWKTKSMNLVSMNQDHGYISYKLGLTFSDKMGTGSYKNAYSLITMNNRNHGLYLAVQKPSKVLDESPMVIRRTEGGFEVKEFRPELLGLPKLSKAKNKDDEFVMTEVQQKAHRRLLEGYLKIEGWKKDKSIVQANPLDPNLYAKLKEIMNIDRYMRLTALQSVLKNGDYTDELFFFATQHPDGSDKVYFDVLPWDFEDLFAVPHDSKENEKAKKNGLFEKSIVYSFEDDLDISLVNNSSMARAFKVQAQMVLDALTDTMIDEAVNEVVAEISPYLEIPAVFEASQKDYAAKDIWIKGKLVEERDSYSKDVILRLLEKRRSEIKTRVRELKTKLTRI